MFERFTDRARRVLVLAQEDARARMHDVLGTEHMLVGLLDEGAGVAVTALKQLRVDPAELREAVVARMRTPQPRSHGAPPFTPHAKRALEHALGEALKLGHNYIGTEHLLLGLVAQHEGIAGQLLVERGVNPTDARRVVAELLVQRGLSPTSTTPSPGVATSSADALTPAAGTVMAAARGRAGTRPVGTHDLLAALLMSDRSAAVHALREQGFDLEALRAAAATATTLHTSDQTPEEAVAAQLDVTVEDNRIVIRVDDETILASLREQAALGSALSATNPELAHDLGSLWRQIHETLTAALQHLAREQPNAAED